MALDHSLEDKKALCRNFFEQYYSKDLLVDNY
jgi:hypothetical protein